LNSHTTLNCNFGIYIYIYIYIKRSSFFSLLLHHLFHANISGKKKIVGEGEEEEETGGST